MDAFSDRIERAGGNTEPANPPRYPAGRPCIGCQRHIALDHDGTRCTPCQDAHDGVSLTDVHHYLEAGTVDDVLRDIADEALRDTPHRRKAA